MAVGHSGDGMHSCILARHSAKGSELSVLSLYIGTGREVLRPSTVTDCGFSPQASLSLGNTRLLTPLLKSVGA